MQFTGVGIYHACAPGRAVPVTVIFYAKREQVPGLDNMDKVIHGMLCMEHPCLRKQFRLTTALSMPLPEWDEILYTSSLAISIFESIEQHGQILSFGSVEPE